MTDLPPKIAQFASFLDAQPGPVQKVFQYCLALLMVEAGKAEPVKTEPGESGPICTFKTVAGDVFSINKPGISTKANADLIERIRVFLMRNRNRKPSVHS